MRPKSNCCGDEREDFINHYLKDKHMGNIFEAIWDDLRHTDDELALGDIISGLRKARIEGDKKTILQLYDKAKLIDFDRCAESGKDAYDLEVDICNDLLYS